ncbi:phosphodiester glycosidase family protein [Actinomadura decatromicini]|uniref:Phosphodiester glycosidase family protein n=1 Tax=Actinomadura decatromicini TaxID=2604572 RepID=A0A5D3FXP0_9ACTN|nr:phosphodiester glycosidase family protein [Actinomadura decatromicini]TYK52792.1 phosphodiester glycosidase family protein [Actinomadura decatromicini]
MRRVLVGVVAAGVVVAGVVPASAGAPPPPGARGADGAGSGERPDARARALPPSARVGTPRFTSSSSPAPGVEFRTFETTGVGGPVVGYLVNVDLRSPGVRVGLLHPPAIAQRQTVSEMAEAQRAVAGINGDFFNISETHPGVPPTGSSSGPEVDGGRPLKGAVPDGQRFGPALPPGTSAEDVVGIAADGRARVERLHLTGVVRTGGGGRKGVELPLRGLNQYAIPVGSAGAFTAAWGAVSRRRAVCGTDTARNAPCSTETAEVTVRRGVVTAVADEVGAGAIPADTVVLVGREKGADDLRRLRPGDKVKVDYQFATRYRFAVGGFPILRDGEPLQGLDPKGPAPRTAAGVSRDGRRVLLVVVDGRSAESAGLTVAELASLLDEVGADDGVNLDGGGSSAVVTRDGDEIDVRNVPSDGNERAVANGIGVFTDARRR